MVLSICVHTRIDHFEIRWPAPSSRVETFTDLPIDRYISIVEGVGIVSLHLLVQALALAIQAANFHRR
jgi:hypothetical protein